MELDFSSQAHYVLALLPEIVLSIWGMVVLIAGVSRSQKEGRGNPADLGWLALVGILLAGIANGWLYGVTEVGNTSIVAVDRFRLFGNWLLLIAGAFSILISSAYVFRQRLQAGEFYSLLLYSVVGMMLMVGARDLIILFLGLEVMSIAVYALAAINRRDRKSGEAGLKYFLLGAFAPDVYEGSPAPVTAFMATAVKTAAFLAFLRVFMVAFQGVYDSWWAILWWLAAITMVVANLIALVQPNVKRMLAYSSIAHAGYLLLAIVAANEIAAAGMLFYLLVYTVMNIGAFGIVIVVAHQGEERLQIEDYAGFGWKQPLLGVLLTIFLLSLAGFPGTGGFIGKIFLLQGAAEAKLWTLAIILVLATVVSYWYYLRVVWFMWMKEAPSPEAHDSIFTPVPMRVALLAGAATIMLTGIFPGSLLDFATASVAGLTEIGGQIIAMIP